MTIFAQYAETTVADLLSAADKGEEVIIARPGKPALRLVADSISEPATLPTPEAPKERKRRILGAGRGEMRVPSEEECAAMDRQIAAEINDGGINGVTWQNPKRPRAELFGALAGQIQLAPDWDSAETNKEIQDLFEGSDQDEAILPQ